MMYYICPVCCEAFEERVEGVALHVQWHLPSSGKVATDVAVLCSWKCAQEWFVSIDAPCGPPVATPKHPTTGSFDGAGHFT